jgi:hypothetical protein
LDLALQGLAKVQEETLTVREAVCKPVVWATQLQQTRIRTGGRPSPEGSAALP